eukprot:g13765.t1
MTAEEEEQAFRIHGSVFRDKPGSVKTTRFLHRVLPIWAQRSFRDSAFRAVSDYGVAVGAGFSAVFRPRHAARFLAVGREREDYRYGPHPRQILEVVQPSPTGESVASRERDVGEGEKPKLIVFVHGGAWGSGCTWMYRLLVDRLTRSNDPQLGAYTVASVGYRVYPDADTNGQVDDLAEAMRWMSGNLGMMGFDSEPDVYLMGHSSGAHISFLYLIRQVEEQEAKAEARALGAGGAGAGAAGAHKDSGTLPSDSLEAGIDNSGGDSSSSGNHGGSGGDGGGGGGCRQLEVEGFIGLAGVYDVYQHYLYESWRGVHEISPMKASHGGMLHTLFDYSHPQLLGRQPKLTTSSWAPPHTPRQPQPSDHEDPSSINADGAEEGGGDAAPAVSSNSFGDLRGGGQGQGQGQGKTSSRTAAIGAALKNLGVPTAVRYDQGGDHFGIVGQLMFTKESLVETAISQFTSQQAKHDARQERANNHDGTKSNHGSPVPPQSPHPEPHSRL